MLFLLGLNKKLDGGELFVYFQYIRREEEGLTLLRFID